MAHTKAAWGMEIGAHAVKAIRLERNGEQVSVTNFAVVPHKKVLSTPDVDADELTRLSLGQFISQNVLEGEQLIISVPGHAAFARFAKLPPVDPKKVPDIVKFEAVQQIPFPIDQVQWDYETFASPERPEIEVGIFAITQERVQKRLALLGELDIAPQALTLSPVAVYNALAFDHELSERKGAVVYLDIGTHATDVIIADAGRCWIRTFPLGGTHFTEAIAKAFKLGYSKAEKLKLEASTSKYAKQIMQAMRPVFSDLLQDLQRSIGYYQSLHRDTKLDLMVGLGSTFRIPGLRKFLGQQLQIQVLRLDEYKKISVAGREAAEFAAAAVNLATAYGLALQGVGLARIDANLMPVENLRSHLWHHKTKWFAAAAAVMVVGAGMSLYRPIQDDGFLAPEQPPVVSQVLATSKEYKERNEALGKEAAKIGYSAENLRRLTDYRRVWPYLMDDAAAALAATGSQDELLSGEVEKIKSVPPKVRRLVELEKLGGDYLPPATPQDHRRIQVTMDVQLSHDKPVEFLTETVSKWLREHAEREGWPYRIIDKSISVNPNLIETYVVTAAGEQRAGSGGRTGGGGTRSGGATQRPPGPPRGGGMQPPGPPAGGPGGFGVSGGDSGPGKRSPSQEKRAPPGPPSGGGVSGAGEDPAPPASQRPREEPGRGGSTGSSSSRSGGQLRDLEQLAPAPTRPILYPPGAEFYRVPITFEVELIDSALPAAPKPSGAAAARGEEPA